MTEHINLMEALSIMEEYDDPFKAADDERLNQFLMDVESAGQNILSPLDPDYLMGAISFLQSTSLSGLLSVSNRLDTAMLCTVLMESDDFSKLVTILFKFCVGLSAIEELH